MYVTTRNWRNSVVPGTWQVPFIGVRIIVVILRNGLELKVRWQKYIEVVYKKDLHDPDNHDGVITHLEPGILECEVKWALESITTNKAS